PPRALSRADWDAGSTVAILKIGALAMWKHLSFLRKIVGAGLVAVGVMGLSGTAARANDYAPRCEYKTVVSYEWVTTYETRTEPYTKCVTLYYHCGRPYEVTKTFYRTYQVPVKKQVAVYKKVPVHYNY